MPGTQQKLTLELPEFESSWVIKRGALLAGDDILSFNGTEAEAKEKAEAEANEEAEAGTEAEAPASASASVFTRIAAVRCDSVSRFSVRVHSVSNSRRFWFTAVPVQSVLVHPVPVRFKCFPVYYQHFFQTVHQKLIG